MVNQRTTLNRIFYTMIAIVGLILQPYAAVVSASAKPGAGGYLSSEMNTVQSGLPLDIDFLSDQCQKNGETSDMVCEVSCVTVGHSAGHCSFFQTNAITPSDTNIVLPNSCLRAVTVTSISSKDGQPNIIYHPPKFTRSI